VIVNDQDSDALRCADTNDELSDAAEDGLDRINGDASLCFAFLRHTGLQL
jgi:hypothetical protein